MPTERFLPLCEQETAALNRLFVLLEDEQRAIVRFESFKLDTLAQNKQQALYALQDMKNARLALLSAHKLDHQQTFQPWLSAASPEIQQAWLALELALARVQALNDINGDLARERMSFATEVLGMLRDEAKGIDGYGRDGNFASVLGGSRRLGSA